MNLFVNQAGRAIDDHDITHTHIKPTAQANPYCIPILNHELALRTASTVSVAPLKG